MSKIALNSNASGTGVFTIASPNSNTDYTINLPEISGGEFVATDASGNVGIGTASPVKKLDVTGTSRITGEATFGNDILLTNDAYVYSSSGGSGVRAGWLLDGTNQVVRGYTAGTERMRIDASGNVGINTASPASYAKLTVESSGLLSRSTANDVNCQISTLGSAGLIQSSTIAGNSTPTVFYNGGTETMRIDSSGNVGLYADKYLRWSWLPNDYIRGQITVTSANHMTFTTAYSERMRIDSSGRVGIGTTTLANPLTVNLTPNANSKISGSAFDGGAIRLTSTTGLSGTNSEMAILAGAEDTLSAGIGFARENGGNWGTQIRFYNHSTSITTTDELTERMRIDASGNVLIGTTSAPANIGGSGFIANPNNRYVLSLGSDTSAPRNVAEFRTSLGLAGRIEVESLTTNYVTSSDVRLKDNIVDAPAGNIDSIKVRSFDWKADGSHQTYGMVAQELVDVAPEAVSQGETEDDMWGVDYSKLVPMMIKEIQDLKAEVAALKGA